MQAAVLTAISKAVGTQQETPKPESHPLIPFLA